MNILGSRINPETFVITRKQLANYLKTDPSRVWRWEKWKHVLWVHIQGRGSYFISYRQLEQWVAACCTLIRACRDLKALNLVWSAIEREARSDKVHTRSLQSSYRDSRTTICVFASSLTEITMRSL